jgi:hypothetical protein
MEHKQNVKASYQTTIKIEKLEHSLARCRPDGCEDGAGDGVAANLAAAAAFLAEGVKFL